VNSYGNILITDAPFIKKINKTLKSNYDGNLFSTLPLPESDWKEKVFTPNFICTAPGFAQCNLPHMALMEARLMIEGEQLILGIPISPDSGRLPLKELRKRIHMATIDSLKPMLEQGGFCIKQTAGEIVVLPTGFLIVQISLSQVWCLRWSLSSDSACTQRTCMFLDEFLASYPEASMPSTGYQQFSAYLKSM
jgi:hypothetical protein